MSGVRVSGGWGAGLTSSLIFYFFEFYLLKRFTVGTTGLAQEARDVSKVQGQGTMI